MREFAEDNNAYYHRLIKRYQNHIIAFVAVVVALSAAWEYQQARELKTMQSAQIAYEEFIESPSIEVANTFQTQYPHLIQSHLAAFYKSKLQFEAGARDDAFETLSWIQAHSDNAVIKTLAQLRMAIICIDKGDKSLAVSILRDIEHDDALINLTMTEAGSDITPLLNEIIESDDTTLQYIAQSIQYENKK